MFGDNSNRMSGRFKLSPGTHVTPDQVQIQQALSVLRQTMQDPNFNVNIFMVSQKQTANYRLQ